ncbi:MAG TPA: type VI secretion system-associated FHA domain protein [Candidatus Nanopelagicales bacterium]|nr:type VI secretion system-associated FHA domain protein [Candidatus Nanopelagicales bacterium]
MPVALTARVFDTQANVNFDTTFERFPVRIGRNQLNDLHIDRPYVSQFHAALDVRDHQIFVRDLGSTNGTVFAGQRIARDTPVEVTQTPEITIGPIVIRLSMVEAAPKKREDPKEGTVLDYNMESSGLSALMAQRSKQVAPGAEDAYVRQLVPYIEAYRAAWGAVYRVIYDHLARLPPEVRQNYLRRLCQEHPSVTLEADFQKISQYYGVDPHAHGELRPADAALVALAELARSLAPGSKVPDDVPGILTFARRLRDTMEVFLKCFVSLRDGYQEFEAEVLARERGSQDDRVSTAKDAKELGAVLLTPTGGPDAARHLYDIFVDVMSHQVALLNGVMEGVRSLLVKLSPRAIEDELDKKGKKGGLFSSRYEELWKLYELRHGDYSGEDKETFLIIFGPQFSRAYAATAGEDYTSSGEAAAKNLSRFSLNLSQVKR